MVSWLLLGDDYCNEMLTWNAPKFALRVYQIPGRVTTGLNASNSIQNALFYPIQPFIQPFLQA